MGKRKKQRERTGQQERQWPEQINITTGIKYMQNSQLLLCKLTENEISLGSCRDLLATKDSREKDMGK